MFTLMLLSAEEKELSPLEGIEALSRYTPRIRKALSEMALRYNINIVGGSHPTRMAPARSSMPPRATPMMAPAG